MAPEDAHNRRSCDDCKDHLTGTDSNYDSPTEAESQSDSRFRRRGFLKLAGVATSGLAATGLSGTASAATTVEGITFDRVLNAVTDLGMDPNGNDPIDDALDSALSNGTLIDFPPGTYLYTNQHNMSGKSRVGIRGTGESHRDVVITCPQGTRNKFVNAGNGINELLLTNFSFDHHRDRDTLIWMWIHGDGCVLKDIEWLGSIPEDPPGWQYLIAYEADSTDAVQLAENLMVGLDAPAVDITYPNGCQFITGTGHYGEVILRDLKVYDGNSSATRYTNISGVVTIEGGEYVNNDNANVRFSAGSHPTKVSSCRGAYIEADGSRKSEDAIRLDSSGNGDSGAIIEDTHIRWSNQPGRGVIAIPDWGEHGGATIRNCYVMSDGTAPAINADPCSTSDDTVVVEGCQFTGTGIEFDSGGRSGSIIRDSCVPDYVDDFNGFDTENLSFGGCQFPNESGSSDSTDSDSGTDESDDTDDGATDLSNTLTIQGTGESANYEFTVSGDLAENADGGSLEDWDTIDGSSANGWVTTTEHVDSYQFSGDLTDFDFLEGSASVTLNGEPYDVDGGSDGSSDEPTEHTLTIRGTGTAANYEFAVSGDLAENADGGSLEDWDTISGSTANGWVTTSEHVDSFLFTGEVTDFTFHEGSADVSVDGSSVDPSSL